MITQKYFKIGTEITYLRHDNELVIHRERGIVRAIFVDQNDRLMVQVKVGENAYNVNYSMVFDLDSNEKGKEKLAQYKKLLKDIRDTSDTGDCLVDKIVAEYNGKVQDITTAVLGAPVEFAELRE